MSPNLKSIDLKNSDLQPWIGESLCHSLLTVLPDGADEVVLRLPQLLHDVLVERVHVLHQPLAGGVVDAARVVQHREVGLAAEVRLGELRAREGARVQIQKGRTTLHYGDQMKEAVRGRFFLLFGTCPPPILTRPPTRSIRPSLEYETHCHSECISAKGCSTDLGVSGVTRDELLHEALVRGLGEPALLVDQRHDAHRLQEGKRDESLKNGTFSGKTDPFPAVTASFGQVEYAMMASPRVVHGQFCATSAQYVRLSFLPFADLPRRESQTTDKDATGARGMAKSDL